jgi:uncharacterized coiled-coil protein SlyX
MDDIIIKLQEVLSHQGEDILRMSDELYTQQREIIALREQLAKLQTKFDAAVNADHDPIRLDNDKPPHY